MFFFHRHFLCALGRSHVPSVGSPFHSYSFLHYRIVWFIVPVLLESRSRASLIPRVSYRMSYHTWERIGLYLFKLDLCTSQLRCMTCCTRVGTWRQPQPGLEELRQSAVFGSENAAKAVILNTSAEVRLLPYSFRPTLSLATSLDHDFDTPAARRARPSNTRCVHPNFKHRERHLWYSAGSNCLWVRRRPLDYDSSTTLPPHSAP